MSDIERRLDAPGKGWTFALLHGPDEAGSRALCDRVGNALGPDADRIDLDGSTLKDDPSRLRDEANAIAMFGGPRWIRVAGGEELLPALQALLEAPQGCPVVVVAGNLAKNSAIAKLAASDPRVLSHTSWKPKLGEIDAIARQLGQAMGVRLSPDAARLLAETTAGDRGVIMRELEKVALYADAAPDRPRVVERGEIEAIGAELDVRESWTLVDALFDGRVADLAGEIGGEGAADAIGSLRALGRRSLNVARVHAARRGGPGPKVSNSESDAVQREGRIWSPAAAAVAHSRIMSAEAAVKAPHTAGEVIAGHAMVALARMAERRR